MTDVEYETTTEEGAGGQIEPIHVVMDKAEEVGQTPEFGTWQNYSWPAATSAIASAQPILPQTRERYEAQIIVVNGAGAAAGAFVRVGSLAQVLNNAGAQLQAGRYPYHSAQPVYAASDGTNAMIINVLDERYL
jgi:hypothetical protein